MAYSGGCINVSVDTRRCSAFSPILPKAVDGDLGKRTPSGPGSVSIPIALSILCNVLLSFLANADHALDSSLRTLLCPSLSSLGMS
jgi:hypothetical protein